MLSDKAGTAINAPTTHRIIPLHHQEMREEEGRRGQERQGRGGRRGERRAPGDRGERRGARQEG